MVSLGRTEQDNPILQKSVCLCLMLGDQLQPSVCVSDTGNCTHSIGAVILSRSMKALNWKTNQSKHIKIKQPKNKRLHVDLFILTIEMFIEKNDRCSTRLDHT